MDDPTWFPRLASPYPLGSMHWLASCPRPDSTQPLNMVVWVFALALFDPLRSKFKLRRPRYKFLTSLHSRPFGTPFSRHRAPPVDFATGF